MPRCLTNPSARILSGGMKAWEALTDCLVGWVLCLEYPPCPLRLSPRGDLTLRNSSLTDRLSNVAFGKRLSSLGKTQFAFLSSFFCSMCIEPSGEYMPPEFCINIRALAQKAAGERWFKAMSMPMKSPGWGRLRRLRGGGHHEEPHPGAPVKASQAFTPPERGSFSAPTISCWPTSLVQPKA